MAGCRLCFYALYHPFLLPPPHTAPEPVCLFTLGLLILHQINVHSPKGLSQTGFLGWSWRWSGLYSECPSSPICSTVRPVFRCAAGPLMLLAMALISSHLNNAAQQRVKRPPTRSVPIMRYFGGRGHTVNPWWMGRAGWVRTVQLGHCYLWSLPAKQRVLA